MLLERTSEGSIADAGSAVRPWPVLAGVDHQVAALQVALDLVRRVGGAAGLYLMTLPHRRWLGVQVTDYPSALDADEATEDRARLAGIRAVAEILGARPCIRHDGEDYMSVDLTEVTGMDLDGVEVDVYTHLHDDTVRAEARALLATADGGAR